LDTLETTSGNVFLTGKAGTGKSTLLRYFRATTKKYPVVVAPTGVAAVNVQGQTIHSFFGWGIDVTPERVRKVSGAYIPEILVETLDQLEQAFDEARSDPSFWQEYEALMTSYSCRPTPLTCADNLSAHFGGAPIYVKREDLNHTGAHKADNVMGQGLLVKRRGKTRVIAETGAGQHGMATATMAAKMGFECTIYMGEVDVERQRPNVFWMQRMGAEVVPVRDGTRLLKDAINEAFRDWVTNVDTTHYERPADHTPSRRW
jgi:tryptophan synthase beta subunit